MIAKKNKKRKRFSENLIYSVLIIIFFVGVVVFLVVSNVRISKKRAEMTTKIDSLKAEIQDLEEKNQQLKLGLSQSGQEAYWEEQIREQGYQKPGEEVTVVIPSTTNQEEKVVQKSFWQKIKEKFGF